MTAASRSRLVRRWRSTDAPSAPRGHDGRARRAGRVAIVLALSVATLPAVAPTAADARTSVGTPVFDERRCTNSQFGGWFYHDLYAGDVRYDGDDPAIHRPLEEGFESQRRFRIEHDTWYGITNNDRVSWAGLGTRPPVRYHLVTAPTHASFFSLSPDGDVEYVSEPHTWGPDSFQYLIEAGGVCSNIATVTLRESVAPRMLRSEYQVRAGEELRSPLACSFTGCGVIRNDLLGPFEVVQVLPSADRDGREAAVDAGSELRTAGGRVTVQPNGRFVYRPDPGFTGEDRFYYTGAKVEQLPQGGTSTSTAWGAFGSLGKVTVEVRPQPAPTAPVARHDGPYDVAEGSSLTLSSAQLRANDHHVAFIPIVDGQSMVGNGRRTVTLRTPNGRLEVSIDGPGCGSGFGGWCPAASATSFRYVPDAGFVGIDGFSYRGTDQLVGGLLSDPVSVEVHVRGDEDPPFASHVATATDERTPVHIDLGAHASDPFVGIDVASIREDPCDHGDCTLDPGGDWELHGDGTVTFTPAHGFVGEAGFHWLVDNRDGDTAGAEAVVEVRWHPSFDDEYAIDEDSRLEVPTPGVLANDRTIDATVSLVRDVAHGALTLRPDGSFTYEPQADHPGQDSFVYAGFEGDTATVSLTVLPVNRAPQVELNARACDHTEDPSCTDPTDPDQRTADDGAPVRLRGSIDDRERDEGVLHIDWGDGATTSLPYPCFDEACDDIISMEPTWDGGCDGTCDGRLFFDLSHDYAATPDGVATVHTIEVVATDVHGATSAPASTTALVRGGGDHDDGAGDDGAGDDGAGDDDAPDGDDTDQRPDRCRPVAFRDVPTTHPHAAAIETISRSCIATGFTDGTYRPAQAVSRGQLATLLANALQLSAGPVRYADVPPHHPHARGISALGDIARGFEDGTFRPDAPVSRAQIATLLRNAAGLPDGTATFTDVPDGSVHADAIAAVAAKGIRGFEDGTYRPHREVTRGQMATFLVRTVLDPA